MNRLRESNRDQRGMNRNIREVEMTIIGKLRGQKRMYRDILIDRSS